MHKNVTKEEDEYVRYYWFKDESMKEIDLNEFLII